MKEHQEHRVTSEFVQKYDGFRKLGQNFFPR